MLTVTASLALSGLKYCFCLPSCLRHYFVCGRVAKMAKADATIYLNMFILYDFEFGVIDVVAIVET